MGKYAAGELKPPSTSKCSLLLESVDYDLHIMWFYVCVLTFDLHILFSV